MPPSRFRLSLDYWAVVVSLLLALIVRLNLLTHIAW